MIKIVSKKLDWTYLEKNYDALLNTVYASRREKIAGYKNHRAALASLGTGLFFQELVEKELGIKPELLNIKTNEYGKPYIACAPEFYLNISHSEDVVVIGYGDSQVGVDVEVIEQKRQDVSIATKYFSQDEKEYVFSDDKFIKERFFEIWTGKEAYLKYIGTGINTSLNSFSVLLSQACGSRGVGIVKGDKVKIELKTGLNYVCSVCTKHNCQVVWEE